MLSREEIVEALGRVIDPELRRPVTELDMVRGVEIDGGNVVVTIALTVVGCPLRSSFEDQVQQHVASLPGVSSVSLQFDVMTPDERATLTTKLRGGAEVRSGVQLPATTRVLAVASGKGGVGKSTTAVNLALGLRDLGLKIGILDADIYGPSLPKLLAIKERPQTIGGTRLKPISRYGLTVMSIGFLIEEETPMIWRGPMVMSALTQMLREVEWGNQDVMVVDMPPGTGDAQLTMAQQVPLAGAIIVSTPQDLALIDARRGIAMFGRVNVPVLGIVENMSYFLCPQCGARTDIFGHGGARKEAERLGVPFLGEVPLDMTIRETSDSGLPVVATQPDGAHAKVYRAIAEKVRDQLNRQGATRAAPKIVIEA
jgi:ATP-binding protein involved in chromosome partitioning